LELEVAARRAGVDPCELIVRDGVGAFRSELELARGWFEHATEGLPALSGAALSREVDRVLDLVARVRTPVHRESLLKDLATRIALPVEGLREQYRSRQGFREPPRAPARPPAPAGAAEAGE